VKVAERNGRRKTREQRLQRRIPEFGYYFIVTDTRETERNYMLGLRDSIPVELQGKLVIKVCKTQTRRLVDDTLDMLSFHPQYGEPWIVFDRDQVKEFDNIIDLAGKNGIKVGWSNPCIETWFSAYFGVMPTCGDSVSCCDEFEEIYSRKTGKQYQKSDKGIYATLCRFGDEAQAVSLAERKLRERRASQGDKTVPSAMYPATTVHRLVEEIKEKTSAARPLP
jgi:hypothetical protein